MLRKLLCILTAALLLAPAAAQAGTRTAGWQIDENGLKVYFKHFAEWTFVTPDNVEENMELCTARGYTAQQVRERFASGRVVWEAYHKRIPDGLIRYEVWTDQSVRNAWNLNLLPTAERNDWVESLTTAGSTGKYTFVDPSYQSMGRDKHIVKTGFIQNPPAEYESGYGGMIVKNGQAMLVGYFQCKDRASKKNYSGRAYEFASSEVGLTDWNSLIFVPDLIDEAVDVTMADDIIINEHTGEIALRGTAEKGTTITAAWGNHTAEATAGSDGTFEVSVPVTVEGEMAVSLTAMKKGYTGNRAFVLSVPVDDSMARLTLTECPTVEVEDTSVTLSGIAAPGAVVFLTLNDEAPVMLYPDENGTFSHTFEDLEDFIGYSLTVTANEDGKNDASVAIWFYRGYGDDISTGISKFKAKTINAGTAKLAANPQDYLGEFVRMEFRTKSVTRENGVLTINAETISSSGSKRYPMILKANGYLNDVIVGGMNVTVYGIVEAPTNENKLPQIRIVYVTYLTVTYR